MLLHTHENNNQIDNLGVSDLCRIEVRWDRALRASAYNDILLAKRSDRSYVVVGTRTHQHPRVGQERKRSACKDIPR